MSARLLRKVLKDQESQLSDQHHQEDSDEEEEPLSSTPSKNPFLLLDDEDEDQPDQEEDEITPNREEPPIPTKPSSKKKSKNNKKKKSKPPKPEQSIDSVLEELSIASALPDKSRARGVDEKRHGVSSSLLLVDPKFLKAENELKKIFGSKVVNSFENQGVGTSRMVRGGRRMGHNPRKTLLVSPPDYWPRWDGSLSIDLLEAKDGIHYFR